MAYAIPAVVSVISRYGIAAAWWSPDLSMTVYAAMHAATPSAIAGAAQPPPTWTPRTSMMPTATIATPATSSADACAEVATTAKTRTRTGAAPRAIG